MAHLLLLAVALQAGSARAAPEVAADATRAIEKANHGEKLFEQGKWLKALKQFREADALYHSPAFVLFAARSLRKSGKLLEARTEYEKLVRETLEPEAPAAWSKAQQEGRAELDKLLREIPSVVVRVRTSEDRVWVLVDGRKIPLDSEVELNPGLHHFQAKSAAKVSRKLVTLSIGERSRVIEIPLAATRRPTGQRMEEPPDANWLGWILTGVGGAAIATGGVFGVLALNDSSDAEGELPHTCVGNTCPSSRRDEIEESMDPARQKATFANAFLIGGSVVAAAGLVILIVDPGSGSKMSARVARGETRLQLRF